MDVATAARLFPLRLSPFEEYMYKDRHPAFPMFFTFRMRRRGGWHGGRLDRAARAAADRHPLLRCTVERLGRNRHQWVLNDSWYPGAHLMQLPADRAFPPTPTFDLTRAPGLKLAMARQGQDGDLFAHFDHACCDGLGALQFLGDLLLAYDLDDDVRALARRWPELHAAQLEQRANRELNWRQHLARLRHQCVGLQRAGRFFLLRPRPLVAHPWPNLNAALPPDHPATLVRALPADQVESLRRQARRHGVTSFEIVLRDLYLTLRDFFAAGDSLRSGDWLRLNIPFSLREPRHARTPAANIVSMVFLDRCPRQMRDPQALLQGIHREMAQVKKYEAKHAFVRFARLLRCLPWSFDLLAASRKCHATALLTNLGKVLDRLPLPYQDGQAVVDGQPIVSLDMVPPFRPLTQLAFSLTGYAGALSMLLHYDSRVVPGELARQLLDGLAERVATAGADVPIR